MVTSRLASRIGFLSCMAFLVPLLFPSVILVAQDWRDRDDGDVASSLPPNMRYLPPSQNVPSQFKLGVSVRNTSTGAVITRVIPGSPAQQIGLETGDAIVTVNGYQVGIVGGRTYDVGDEIQRRLMREGSAVLLVLNQRDGRLINLPIDGAAPNATILGTVSTSDPKNVYPSMTLDVRLVDITHPQWRDVSLAETQLPVMRWPMGFRLDVDPSLLKPNHRYAVEAQVSNRGQVIQKTANPVVVNPNNASQVSLVLVNADTRPTYPNQPGGVVPNSPLEQVNRWYQDLLGRTLADRERTVWQRELARGKPPEEILATILGSSEYYERFGGNQRAYVADVFQYIHGRNPSTPELQRWTNRLAQLRDVRFTLVEEMLRERSR